MLDDGQRPCDLRRSQVDLPINEAGGHADLPLWNPFTQLQMGSACPSYFNSPRASVGRTVDQTDARKATLRRFGRSDQRTPGRDRMLATDSDRAASNPSRLTSGTATSRLALCRCLKCALELDQLGGSSGAPETAIRQPDRMAGGLICAHLNAEARRSDGPKTSVDCTQRAALARSAGARS